MTGYLQEETRSSGQSSETPRACKRRRRGGGGAFDENDKGEKERGGGAGEGRRFGDEGMSEEGWSGNVLAGNLLHRFNPDVATRRCVYILEGK